MEQQQPTKPAAKSKTLWGIVGTLGSVLAMTVGLHPDSVAFLADGFQPAEDAAPLLTLLSLAVAAWGIRRGTQPGAQPVAGLTGKR
jgi:hypothetical protein